MKKFKLIYFALVIILALSGCSKNSAYNEERTHSEETASNSSDEVLADISKMDFDFSNKDIDPTYNQAQCVKILADKSNAEILGEGAIQKEGSIVISKGGTYIFSGNLEGNIKVEAGQEEKVQLVLNNINIHNSSGPAIYLKSADKVFLTLGENSSNTLSDEEGYELVDEETTVDAALFSKTDLSINGEGSLLVEGKNKHGIVSKDDLIIASGNISVQSKNVALSGKDCVKIASGTLNLTAGTDGIRSDNADDELRGYVYVRDGSIKVLSENDAIQAYTVVKCDGGKFELNCGGGSQNASYTDNGNFNADWEFNAQESSEATSSAKGIKAGHSVVIVGGSYVIDSADDALHADQSLNISGGEFTVSSGDDGFHADDTLTFSGGKVNILKSYEGIEASEILISGGDLEILSTDDGINAAGGNDLSGLSDRPGMGGFSRSTGEIEISGGYIVINAEGDGIDSNGTLNVSGGTTLISGPTKGGNGSFDYDGSATVSGGVLIALGSSSMAQNFSTAENQGAILETLINASAKTAFSLCDEKGNVIVSFTPSKGYNCVLVTAPEIIKGQTYSLVVGGTVKGADKNGFAKNTTVTNGQIVTTIALEDYIYGGTGSYGGAQQGHGGGFEGNKKAERYNIGEPNY